MNGLFEPTHLILIAAAALLIFGPKRLPAVGRQVGKWLGELRSAAGGLGDEVKAGLTETSSKPAVGSGAELPATAVEVPKSGPKDAPGS